VWLTAERFCQIRFCNLHIINQLLHSRKLTAQQSGRLGAYFAASVAASMAASSEIDAAIVFFDVNPNLLLDADQQTCFGSINLSTATYNSSSTSPSFTLSNLFGFLEFDGMAIDTAMIYGLYLRSFAATERAQLIKASIAIQKEDYPSQLSQDTRAVEHGCFIRRLRCHQSLGGPYPPPFRD
jgi:hypothetical protein